MAMNLASSWENLALALAQNPLFQQTQTTAPVVPATPTVSPPRVTTTPTTTAPRTTTTTPTVTTPRVTTPTTTAPVATTRTTTPTSNPIVTGQPVIRGPTITQPTIALPATSGPNISSGLVDSGQGPSVGDILSGIGGLFGGGSGGGSSVPTNVVTTTSLPAWQEAGLQDLLNRTTALVDAGGRQFFPGDTVADLDPRTTMGLNDIARTAQPGGQVANLVGSALSNNMMLQDTNRLLQDPTSLYGVQGFIDNIVNRGQQQLTESLLPAVRGQAILAGGLGGSANKTAEAMAAERIAEQGMRSLNDFNVNLLGNLLNANTAALNRAPAMAQLGLLPGQAQVDAGNVRQNQNQAEIAGERERFEFGQNEPFAMLDQLRATLGTGQAGQTTRQSTGTDRNTGSDILGLILGGAGLGLFDPILRGLGLPGVGGAGGGDNSQNFTYFNY